MDQPCFIGSFHRSFNNHTYTIVVSKQYITDMMIDTRNLSYNNSTKPAYIEQVLITIIFHSGLNITWKT